MSHITHVRHGYVILGDLALVIVAYRGRSMR